MSQNIDDFNAGVAIVMGKLYENFPKPINLITNELHHLDFKGDDPDATEKINRWVVLSNLYFYTSLFLLEEGYIRGTERKGHIIIDDCVLTSKGLAALQRVPDSLKGKQSSIGEWFAMLAKDSAKEVTKEAVKAGVRLVLAGG